ncbi:MAG: aldehyde dehydrogenase family protein [Synergistaceae bacterium]|jgi:succinate-semialdehyde dehydrogenase/glutarate-semialdehyde dehydrogenase|nr:aldehyde dehydrogenase family protein [Synergistaceae bacterium]
MNCDKMYINGKLTEGRGKPFDVVNPATGEVIKTLRAADESQAEEALQAAKAAEKTWGYTSINERIGWMNKLRDSILAEKGELLEIVAAEGKSYSEALGQITTFVGYMNFYAEEVKRVYGTGVPEYAARRGQSYHTVIRRPLGVVVGHLPWNSPLNLLGVKLAPSMASGCPCVLKPSTSTPLASIWVAEMAEHIGLPAGAFNLVCGPASVVGKYLNESKIPKMVTIVGSSEAGLEVMQQAATSIKRFSFELGGNAPCIIMPDVDMDVVIPWLASRKVAFCGQGCANVNRIFVHESLHDILVPKLTELVKKIKVGWGADCPDSMGPLINVRNRDNMLALVERTVAQGAKMTYGGKPDNLPAHLEKGAFILPTILDNCTDDMEIADTEIFGPVYTIFTFNDLDEAIKRANNTKYGLSSYLMTHDSRVIAKCVEDLEFGEVDVNMPGLGPNLPHVGIKESGVGCDRSLWSLDEFFSIRRISICP